MGNQNGSINALDPCRFADLEGSMMFRIQIACTGSLGLGFSRCASLADARTSLYISLMHSCFCQQSQQLVQLLLCHIVHTLPGAKSYFIIGGLDEP